MEVDILYEDDDVLVVNKPAGILVHGVYGKDGPKHNEQTLVDWLLERYPDIKGVGDILPNGTIERAGIVHRLDRETSGVLVLAKHQDAFMFLKDLFKTQTIQKTYRTLVWGRVKEQSGVIDKPISIKDGSVRRTVFRGKMTREAITEYRVIHYCMLDDNEMTFLEITPKTGRTHQIRVHLNAIGHPVLGDKLYGKKPIPEYLGRHFLHASSLTFTLPSGKAITITADMPAELEEVLRRCQSTD